jgi:hypothetical protein
MYPNSLFDNSSKFVWNTSSGTDLWRGGGSISNNFTSIGMIKVTAINYDINCGNGNQNQYDLYLSNAQFDYDNSNFDNVYYKGLNTNANVKWIDAQIFMHDCGTGNFQGFYLKTSNKTLSNATTLDFTQDQKFNVTLFLNFYSGDVWSYFTWNNGTLQTFNLTGNIGASNQDLGINNNIYIHERTYTGTDNGRLDYIKIDGSDFLTLNQTYSNSSLEGIINFTTFIQAGTNVNLNNATIIWNGTSFLASQTNYPNNVYLLSKTLNQSTESPNSTIQFQWNLTLSNSTNTFYSATNLTNQTIYKIYIGNCSDSVSTIPTLNYTLLDEDTLGSVNGTIQITHNLYANGMFRNYSFIFNNITTATNCIYPSWATYLDQALLQYFSLVSSYSQRSSYLNTNISNISQNVNLYLLPNSESYSALIFVRDQNNNPLPNYLVIVQRYYAGTGTYNTVDQCISSNPKGQCSTYLRILDTFYRFTVLDNSSSVVFQTSPYQIVCTPFDTIGNCPPYPVPLQIQLMNPAQYFQVTNNIAYSCYLNQSSGVLSCSVLDTSGQLSSTQFSVSTKGALEFTTLCNQTQQSFTGSLTTYTCSVGNVTGNIYQYQLLGFSSLPASTTTSNLILLSAGTFDFSTGLIIWGVNGLFIAFIIISTMGLFGSWNPVVSILMTASGIIGTVALNMIQVSIPSLIGLLLVLGIIAWRVRS